MVLGFLEWVRKMSPTLTDENATRQVISQQPLLGSLFKSQNGSTWDASQFEDLKFTMYRSQFTTGTRANASFYNPDMGLANGGLTKLGPIQFKQLAEKPLLDLVLL